MSKIIFLFKILFWLAIIGFFAYNPGEVSVNWLGYDIKTSLFFLFVVIFFVDKIISIIDKILHYIIVDFWKNLKISFYESEVKNLKKNNAKGNKKIEKLEKKYKTEKQKTKKIKRQIKVNKYLDLVKKIFRKK
ncbi:MAG: hypothetical protein ACTSXL_05850 [Alphaproteobacteria bacterium]